MSNQLCAHCQREIRPLEGDPNMFVHVLDSRRPCWGDKHEWGNLAETTDQARIRELAQISLPIFEQPDRRSEFELGGLFVEAPPLICQHCQKPIELNRGCLVHVDSERQYCQGQSKTVATPQPREDAPTRRQIKGETVSPLPAESKPNTPPGLSLDQLFDAFEASRMVLTHALTKQMKALGQLPAEAETVLVALEPDVVETVHGSAAGPIVHLGRLQYQLKVYGANMPLQTGSMTREQLIGLTSPVQKPKPSEIYSDIFLQFFVPTWARDDAELFSYWLANGHPQDPPAR